MIIKLNFFIAKGVNASSSEEVRWKEIDVLAVVLIEELSNWVGSC